MHFATDILKARALRFFFSLTAGALPGRIATRDTAQASSASSPVMMALVVSSTKATANRDFLTEIVYARRATVVGVRSRTVVRRGSVARGGWDACPQ